MKTRPLKMGLLAAALPFLMLPLLSSACINSLSEVEVAADQSLSDSTKFDTELKDTEKPVDEKPATDADSQASTSIEEARSRLNLSEDMRPEFIHGEKGAEFQKYIVLHDTEGESSPKSVVDYWDGNNNLIAAHFVIGLDGSIVQCVPLDKIAHHAGFGDTGHNEMYAVSDESRDDRQGTQPIGSWASDYGMNSYSIGIELVHLGASQKDYPEVQLEALDNLLAYLDAYFYNTASGDAGVIIDHKAWRSGNSDTSKEFAQYLENYQARRTHS